MNTMKQIIAILLLALVALSCKKESPVGPNLVDLYGTFAIIDPLSIENPLAIDFTQGNAQFKGKWSLITNWTLTIKGQNSGAFKIIKGKSNTLDTTLGQWDGTAEFYLFKKDEECNAILTFDGYPDTLKTNIKIKTPHDFSKDGYIIQDFNLTSFTATGGGTTTINKTEQILNVPEGNNYLRIEGTEPGSSWWFGALPSFTPSSFTGSPKYFPFLNKDTASLYMNFFVYNYGYLNTKIDISWNEDDNGDGTYVGKSNTTDTTKIEDSYMYELEVSKCTLGWQKISVPLSKFPHAGVWIADKQHFFGDRKMEISKIVSFDIAFVTTGDKTDKVGCAVDFFIITKGKPL